MKIINENLVESSYQIATSGHMKNNLQLFLPNLQQTMKFPFIVDQKLFRKPTFTEASMQS